MLWLKILQKQLVLATAKAIRIPVQHHRRRFLHSLSLSHPAVRQFINEGHHDGQLESIISAIRLKEQELSELERMSSDPELKDLAAADVVKTRAILEQLESDFFTAVLPPDESDLNNDLVMEFSAGVGGQEAMLFTQELYNMYAAFISSSGWSLQPFTHGSSDLGGLRHASVGVSGPGAYSALKYEGGVHRVQRVPATERGGRIHTSTSTVAVLPAPRQGSLSDVEIPPNELRIETKKATGAGGQHVNTTESAVRITHLPTGISVDSQMERSQPRNRELGLQLLKAKLYDLQVQKEATSRRTARKLQVGGGQRNEKIRTYNWPQDRVTDHRIGVTLHDLPGFMVGGKPLEVLIGKLQEFDREERLNQLFSQFSSDKIRAS